MYRASAGHARMEGFTEGSVTPVPMRISALMFFPVLMLVFRDLVAFDRVVMAFNDHIATRLDGAVTVVMSIMPTVAIVPV